jgi:hypothetical protein
MALSDNLPRGEGTDNRDILDIRRDIRELGPSVAKSFKPVIASLQATIIATIQATYTTTVDMLALLAGKSDVNHKHAASDITTGGTTGAGFTVGGDLSVNGDATANRGIFPTGVRSTGARANVVTQNYVAAYLDANGNLGYAPSTLGSKNVLGPFQVDMQRWLNLPLYRFTYKDDPESREVVGPLADDLHAAGLKEFVVYDEAGNIQGVRTETLLIGLWSAYLQSRMATQARIGNMKYQKQTVTGMTALGLNAEKTYDVVWPTEFADANYHATADVFSTTGLALAAVASIVPGSETSKGCKISVRTLGLALAVGSTLTVKATHI